MNKLGALLLCNMNANYLSMILTLFNFVFSVSLPLLFLLLFIIIIYVSLTNLDMAAGMTAVASSLRHFGEYVILLYICFW